MCLTFNKYTCVSIESGKNIFHIGFFNIHELSLGIMI